MYIFNKNVNLKHQQDLFVSYEKITDLQFNHF